MPSHKGLMQMVLQTVLCYPCMQAHLWLNFQFSLCHGFVTLLLVFHIITSWTKEKNYVSQRTSRSEKEDTSRKIRHLVARGLFHFHLLPGRGVGVLPSRAPSSSRAFGFGNSLSLSISISLFRSLSFHLIYYPYFQLDCIISCHLAFQHHS